MPAILGIRDRPHNEALHLPGGESIAVARLVSTMERNPLVACPADRRQLSWGVRPAHTLRWHTSLFRCSSSVPPQLDF